MAIDIIYYGYVVYNIYGMAEAMGVKFLAQGNNSSR